MTEFSSNATVYDPVLKVYQKYKIYYDESATRHAGADLETIRKELAVALNKDASAQEDQGDNVYRVKINGGKGYIVYKTGVSGALSACVFHYHWNYTLDIDLRVF